jgi:hypothetical protein
VVEINSDAEDQLLVEALQEYEDSKFGADTTRMDLKPSGPTSFITPALRERELFIGTQFSNLHTAVDTPAKGRVGARV